MKKKLKNKLIVLLIVLLILCFTMPNKIVLAKNITDVEKEKLVKEVMSKVEIKNDKQYEIIDNVDGTKIILIYNILGKKNNINAPDNMLEQVEKDINFYYSETGGNSYDNGVYNHKIEICQLAKKLNLNNLLTKMKDFCYHPYAVCEYDKFTKEELVILKKELEKVFDEYKEIDHGGPTGFASNSVIANIKSIDIAIKNYNEENHKKYKKLPEYMFNDGVYDKYFTLSKNLVNLYESPYERTYKRTPINRTEIRNIKDTSNYYEADIIFRENVSIDREIGDKIKKGDIVVLWTCPIDEMNKENAFIIKCIDTRNDDEENENWVDKGLGEQFFADKHRWFKLIKGNDEYDKYDSWEMDEDVYYMYSLENENYTLENCAVEAELNLAQQVKMSIRILKNARVFGSYWLDSIDKAFSNNHDYEFKEEFKDVVLSDIYNKNISFNYSYGKEYYYPIVIENKNFVEDEDVYAYMKPYLCDNFQYVTMLTFDDKGYISGIYKGES